MIISKLKKILTWTLTLVLCGNFLFLTPPIQKIKAVDDWKFDPTTKKLTKDASTYELFKNTTTMSYQGVEKATAFQEFVFKSDQDPNIFASVSVQSLPASARIQNVFDASTLGGNWAAVGGISSQNVAGINTSVTKEFLFPSKYYVINPKCVDEKGNPVSGLTVQARLSNHGAIMSEAGPTDSKGDTHFDASGPNYYWPDPSVQDFELLAFDDSSESGTPISDSNPKYWLGQLNLNTSSDFKQGEASDRYIANKNIVIVVKESDTPPKQLSNSISGQIKQTILGDDSVCEAEFDCGKFPSFRGAICKAQCAVIDFTTSAIAWVIREILYPSLGLSTSGYEDPNTTPTTTPNTTTPDKTTPKVDNSIDQGT